jgi:hypothetical protein
LHRDNFAAKEPGFCPVLSSGNVYSLNRRAVSKNAFKEIGPAPELDKFLITSKLDGILIEKADAHPVP